MNKNAHIIDEHIKKYFNEFSLQKFYKLNPSIINLDNNIILISYRIYMGELTCDTYDLDNCHPWKNMWSSSLFSQPIPISKLNFVGLCKYDLITNKVVEDTILIIKDGPLGLEDVRLFEHNNIVYINGAMTVGNSGKAEGQWYDDRILRQGIVKLNTKINLLNELPKTKLNVEINCIKLHGSNMEKNWFGYNKNNNLIIVNPTFGKFFPLNQYILDFNNLEDLSNESTEKHHNQYKKIKSYHCTKNNDIAGLNIIQNINEYYKDCLKNSNKKLFRLSGGSWGVKYDNDHMLFVGHIVAYVNELDMEKIKIQFNIKNQKSDNLYSFIKNRQYQLTFFNNTMRYYQVLFKININTNEFTELSHAFNVFETKTDDTSVNFPIGLVRINDEFIISFGESDYKTCLIRLDKIEIDKLFMNTEPENYKFMTFNGQNKKKTCYTDITNDNYYKKYLKYKQKYLELKNKY